MCPSQQAQARSGVRIVLGADQQGAEFIGERWIADATLLLEEARDRRVEIGEVVADLGSSR